MGGTMENNGENRKAPFVVECLRRGHSSWQGRVFWPEGGKRRNFRGEPELICLPDKTLDPSDVRGFDSIAVISPQDA